MAKSAKTAEQNLDITRIPEQPSITMPGTVDKIIPAKNASQPEKAVVSVDGPPQAHQALRVENTLTDENGDVVNLKKGAHVHIIVTDETSAPK
jgi:hypothetical protein